MHVQRDNTKQTLSARNDQVCLKNCSCFETDFGEDFAR